MNCVRGCMVPRKHLDECDNEACRGCLPEEATEGALCYSCHVLLKDALTHAPGQVSLLRATEEPSSEQALTIETARVHVGPRLDSEAPHYITPASTQPVAGSSEPVRLAALAVAQELEDILSQWVEQLAGDYRINTPQAKASTAQREDSRKRVWMPELVPGMPRSRWETVVYRGPDVGQYVWVDPPERFEVSTACRWLLTHLNRLEHLEGIGDEMESLSAAMGQAHSIVPWREQVSRLRGIPCPHCQRVRLVLYGGMSDVTCESCGKRYPWERYAIWVKMYERGIEGWRFEASDADDSGGS